MELHGLGLLVYEMAGALGKSFSAQTQLTFGADTLGCLSVVRTVLCIVRL